MANSPTNATDPSGLEASEEWRDGLIPRENVLIMPVASFADGRRHPGVESWRKYWFDEVVVKAFAAAPISADFLAHSLQDSPGNMRFGQRTEIARTIADDPDFRRAIRDEVLKKGRPKGQFQSELKTNWDLSHSIHGYTADWKFVVKNGGCHLEIGLQDTYDFEFGWGNIFKGKPGLAVNVLADHIAKGIVQRYQILVKIDLAESDLKDILSIKDPPKPPPPGPYEDY